MKKKEAVHACRARVLYGGRVQGVGFRYTAEKLAMDLKLMGWVKNLPDGRVEIVCEGPKEKIELFLKSVREGSLGPYIRKADCEWQKPTHEFKEFRIEFCF